MGDEFRSGDHPPKGRTGPPGGMCPLCKIKRDTFIWTTKGEMCLQCFQKMVLHFRKRPKKEE